MKRSKIWLSVAAVLAGTVSSWAGEPGQTPSYSADNSGVTTFVGDIPMDSEIPSVTKPVGYTTGPVSHVNTSSFVEQVACNECTGGGAPCGSGCSSGCDSGCSSGCDSICDSGCDSMGCGGGAGLFGGLGMGSSSGCGCPSGANTWASIDTLLWWAEDRQAPVLISTGPAANVVPNINPGLGTAQFGGTMESDMLVGNRIDVGRYFGSDQVLGAGARFYGLWNGDDTVTQTYNGNASLGVPFFDTFGGIGSTAFLVGFNTGIAAPNPDFSGTVTGTSGFDFLGSEAYTRALFGKGRNYRVDLLGGFTYHSIDDSITLAGTSTQFNNLGPIAIFNWADAFTAENTFFGGQVGVETQVQSGRFTLTSLAKVHLGNMRQRVTLAGASSLNNLGVGVTNFANNGLLVQGNNGSISRNNFTFTPELNTKLGVQLADGVNFNVGYSFILWTDMALAGNHIDNRIDSTVVGVVNNPAGNPPVLAFNSDTFFLHGLDLGLTFTF